MNQIRLATAPALSKVTIITKHILTIFLKMRERDLNKMRLRKRKRKKANKRWAARFSNKWSLKLSVSKEKLIVTLIIFLLSQFWKSFFSNKIV